MKNLSPKEAITILEGMRIDIPVPKAAVTQIKRNLALDMAINALNCSEIPNNSDVISRQAALETIRTMQTYKLFAGDDMLLINQAEAQTELMMLPSVQPETNCSEIPNNSDTIYRQQAIDALKEKVFHNLSDEFYGAMQVLDELPSAQPERKTGHWILDRSGAYCCDKCMEPCAGYVMMKPRDKFCKMCGSRNEVME